jgi:hypothetical protein
MSDADLDCRSTLENVIARLQDVSLSVDSLVEQMIASILLFIRPAIEHIDPENDHRQG